MERLTKDELVKAYRKAYDAIPQEALELDLRVTVKTIQELAEGNAISPVRLAEIWEMSLEQVHIVLDQAAAAGRAELDAQGNLVAGVLSLVPTAHRISMDGKQLYAWCAYDAIYIPGVVGKSAQITSRDPETGDSIKISITPLGVAQVRPEGTVVSVVGPDEDTRGGAASPRCSRMLFFGSRDSADRWLQGRSGIAVLSVEEVYEIARQFQIEPARRLGLV
jgi:alkylmercury lyase